MLISYLFLFLPFICGRIVPLRGSHNSQPSHTFSSSHSSFLSSPRPITSSALINRYKSNTNNPYGVAVRNDRKHEDESWYNDLTNSGSNVLNEAQNKVSVLKQEVVRHAKRYVNQAKEYGAYAMNQAKELGEPYLDQAKDYFNHASNFANDGPEYLDQVENLGGEPIDQMESFAESSSLVGDRASQYPPQSVALLQLRQDPRAYVNQAQAFGQQAVGQVQNVYNDAKPLVNNALKYGQQAVGQVSHYGDQAIQKLTPLANTVAGGVKKYGGEAIEKLTPLANDVARGVKKYGGEAIEKLTPLANDIARGAEKVGKQALSAVKKFGSDMVNGGAERALKKAGKLAGDAGHKLFDLSKSVYHSDFAKGVAEGIVNFYTDDGPPTPNDIEDCVGCLYVLRHVEANVGTTSNQAVLYDAFQNALQQAGQSPIFFPVTTTMQDRLDDLLIGYVEGLSANQICEEARICRDRLKKDD